MNPFSPENSPYFFQIQSAGILLLMMVGVALRRTPSKHVRIMATAIAWDILLILQIELSRGAIAKASKVVTNTTILNVHVTIAVLCVVLYAIMVFTGRKMLMGETAWRGKHRFFGMLTLFMRLLTFATSFFTVSPQ